MTLNLHVYENVHVSISLAHIYRRITHRKIISELGLQGEDDMAHQFDTVVFMLLSKASGSPGKLQL